MRFHYDNLHRHHGRFHPDKTLFATASTDTLANIAADAMNKVVQAQLSHLQFWRWYERLAVPVSNDGSVHDMKLITLGGIGDLPPVTEGAAYTELTVDDVQETAPFTKKGGYVGITLEMIRNSAIREIQAIPKALAIAAVRTRSAAVASLFTANSGVGPTLSQDSKALFHADHNNLATTAFGTDAAAWRAARVECFNHVELHSGKKLAVYPKFLLVPDDLYDQALVITGYGEGMPTTYTPEAQARNAADPRPVVITVPDWTDANDWAYLVDPKIYPVIQITYAQSPGRRHPPAPPNSTASPTPARASSSPTTSYPLKSATGSPSTSTAQEVLVSEILLDVAHASACEAATAATVHCPLLTVYRLLASPSGSTWASRKTAQLNK